MASWVKELPFKPDDLIPSLDLTWSKERTDSWKSSSDLCEYICMYTNPTPHTPQRNKCKKIRISKKDNLKNI